MKHGFLDYLKHSFAGSASAVALAGTILAPLGAVLGTPRTAEAGSTINLVGPDFSNGVYNAKEDDQDLRIGLSVPFDSFTHRHVVTVEVNGGQPSDWTFTGTSGSFDQQTGVWSISFSPGISIINATPKFSFSNNSDINHTLTIRAQQFDASNNLVSETVRQATVKIDAVADTPDIAANPTTGYSNENITLNVDAAPADVDGSEVVCLKLNNVPTGISFANGIMTGTGEWTFTDLPPVLSPTGAPVDFTATGTATSVETNLDDFDDVTSDNTATSGPVDVHVTTTTPPPPPLECPGISVDPSGPDVSSGLKGMFKANLAAPGKQSSNSLMFQLSVETPASAFGDPLSENGTNYLICAYGPNREIISQTVLTPGTVDAKGNPNFKTTTKGFTYKDPKKEHGPVIVGMFKESVAGKGNGLLKFVLKGEATDMPGTSGGPAYLGGRAIIQITARYANGSQHTWHAELPDVKMDKFDGIKATGKYSASCNDKKGPPCMLP